MEGFAVEKTITRIKELFGMTLHVTTASEWIQFALVLGLGVLCVSIANRIGIKMLVGWLKKKKTPAAESIGSAVQAPVNVFVIVFFLNTGKSVFRTMPGWLWQKMENGVTLIYAIATLVFLFRLIDIGLSMLRQHWKGGEKTLDEQMIHLMDKVLKGLAVVLVVITVLHQFGVQVLGLVTGLGFLGAAFALAAQSTLGNVIGSFEILADRLFKVGDRIAFGDYDGFVSKMGLRSVELCAITGERINLPNKDLVDKQIRNYTRGKHVKTTLSVGLTYDHTRERIERAMSVLNEVFETLKKQSDLPEIDRQQVSFCKFAEFYLDIQVVFWAKYDNVADYQKIMTVAHLAIKEAFDGEGIEMAFPTQTLLIKK